MGINKKLIAAIAVPVVLGGWALFRPELIFINKEVHETLPTQSQAIQKLALGSFTSQAHETKGSAEIVMTGGKTYLQLKDFSTSNGPDVRVYLTDGGRPGKDSLSLGSLKGNIGTQNYTLPAGFDPMKHKAVSIWCERFAVGFGLATLMPEKLTGQLAAPESPVMGELIRLGGLTEVTFGSVQGSPKFSGRAALLEDQGKRWADVKFKKFAPGFELRLVKKENLALGEFPKADFVPLKAPGQNGQSSTPLDKKIDLWLYRSIAILDPSTKKIVAFIPLRSQQELKKQSAIVNFY